ncbi:hydroxymethylglutaryl-CoA lyase [Compostibacter hankyongensis]|uniref:Hydroxymethylglutaryl-CoA lyase n=1 Tax=Compostibacter hankyongensis TaxID=1007089 RepID=A0ABP8FPE5_9BACT
MPDNTIKLIECPRDAMQGWPHPISTAQKTAYIRSLLTVGFDTLDFGSFVSPKAIPQMADTGEVIAGLDTGVSRSRLLAIVANVRGAEEALKYEAVHFLGFPFSISETFQRRNANSTIAEAMERVIRIRELCREHGRQLVIYISMGFGNPYGDPYDRGKVIDRVQQLVAAGISIISLADTVGVADPGTIAWLFGQLIPAFPGVEFGAHLHARPDGWEEKISAAWEQGCRRFDTALGGIGGCPMAGDELVGNMATERLVRYCEKHHIVHNLDTAALEKASDLASQLFRIP